MKIAIAGAATSPDWGGGEPQFARRLSEGFRAEGDEVVAVPSARSALRVLAMGSSPWAWDLGNVAFFRQALEKLRPDIVLGFYDYDSSLLHAARDLSLPHIQVVQVYWPVCPLGTLYIEGLGVCDGAEPTKCLRHMSQNTPRSRLPFLPERFVPAPLALPLYIKFRNLRESLNQADHVVVPSEAMQRYLAARGMRNVVAIKVGIPLDEISPGAMVPSKKIVLFNSGSPIERKGMEHFQEVRDRLASKWPSVEFRTTSYRSAQGAESASFLTRPQLVDLIRKSYVCVLPVRWMEPFPAAALEAMAAAKPVVTYDTGGMPEIVESGVTGVVVPRGDVAALTGAVDELLADEDKAARMGRAGRDKVEKEFGFELMLRRFRELLRTTIERRE